MTTVRNSWRSKSLAAVATGLVALASVPALAHRRDEYLQAARIALDPGRVQIALDLTPGIAVAQGIIADIDRDRNGVLAADESQAYAARVVSEIHLALDSRPLAFALIDHRFPAIDDVLNGQGTIQLTLAATMPPLPAGVHRLVYRNAHRPDIGVYLANALVPTSARLTVVTQIRDVDQRELAIEYVTHGDEATRMQGWGAAAVIGALVLAAAALWRRSVQ